MRRGLLLLLLSAGCGDSTRTVANVDLAFESPAHEASVFSAEPFTTKIRATTNEALKSLELLVGTLPAKTCPPGDDPTEIVCEQEIDPREWAGQQQDGTLTLTAKVTTTDDDTKETSIRVNVTPVLVEFVQPTAGSMVRGTSTLEFRVRGEVAIEQIRVVDEEGLPLTQLWNEPWSTEIDWPAFLGPGSHVLSAEAVDAQSRSGTARLELTVACESASDCDSGESCCDSGACAASCN